MFFFVVMSGTVHPGSVFVKEALQRAIELTDAAYARTSERSKCLGRYGNISDTQQSMNNNFVLALKTNLLMFPGWRSLCLEVHWDPVTCWLSLNRLKPEPGLRSGLQNCWTTQWSWSERWSTLILWCSPTLRVLNSSITQHTQRGFCTCMSTSTTTSTYLSMPFLHWLSVSFRLQMNV